MRYLIILTLLITGICAEETPESALRVLKAMNLEIAKERSKAIKSLESELAKAMKAGKLEDSVAIKKIIDELTELLPKTEDELVQGDAIRKMAGRRIVDKNPWDYWFFRADGTLDCPTWGGGSGTWKIEDKTITVTCKTGVVILLTVQSPEVWLEESKGKVWNLQR